MTDWHPALNAALNLTAASLLVSAWFAIRRRDVAGHRARMLAAVAVSTVFLVSYLIRFAVSGVHRYPDVGWSKTVYLVILGTHTVLAATVPFLAARALYLAWKQRFPEHRRIARIAFPIWFYVSVTGVVVYLMLYQLAPRLSAST
jgi:putative membrane protein